jgi:hypothetical protein
MRRSGVIWVIALSLLACDEDTETVENPVDKSCVGSLEVGDDLGHADPFGARAAGQARAARLVDASAIAQPAHGRQPIQDGDFVLVNDKIAVVVEDMGLSDGYARFGGEILAVDRVGDDGRPAGESMYVETLVGLGLTMPDPTSVSVLSDGSDGGEAVVRVIGRTRTIPFLDGSISKIFKSDYDLEVAYDYVLEPGGERVTFRLSVVNPDEAPIDFGVDKSSIDEVFGFFHSNRNQMVTPELGFEAEGIVSWVGFVSPPEVGFSFAWRSLAGPLEFGIAQSGFSLFFGSGFLADGCSITTSDRFEIVGGGPGYDGLRETIRRMDGDPAWHAISGQVRDADGNPVADAFVHELDEDDLYLSRTSTAADGSFTIHAPPDQGVRLVAQKRGYLHDGQDVAVGADSADLSFAPHATLHVTAERQGDGVALPVRVQVIPVVALPSTPSGWGVLDEKDGRLHQDFAIHGESTLVVPPGEHRVIVSRGYEYELYDELVTVAAGETAEVNAVLAHSVDSTGTMCADFHLHSYHSADSSDPVDYKVKGAVADGLDIPVSSEHEWVIDFAPVVESLGLGDWAFGMPSSELTTFLYGHFGVVPLLPRPGEYKSGAIDWIGKTPAETFAAVDERPEQPALIVNHPSGSGFGAYFSYALLDKETGEPGIPEHFSDNFDAVEVFNGSSFDQSRDASVAHWFALLNAGMKVFAVGNSDSHHLRSSPAGYPRTCFWFGHDDPQQLTHDAVRDAILVGDGNVSGGLFMTVAGPAGEHPGQTVSPGTSTFVVSVESPSWVDAQDLEVIVDGVTVSTETLLPLGSGPSHHYVNQVAVDLAAGSWVVFHARGDGDLAPLHPGRAAFAVSNPIFAE